LSMWKINPSSAPNVPKRLSNKVASISIYERTRRLDSYFVQNVGRSLLHNINWTAIASHIRKEVILCVASVVLLLQTTPPSKHTQMDTRERNRSNVKSVQNHSASKVASEHI
jgi:hypothetical protein